MSNPNPVVQALMQLALQGDNGAPQDNSNPPNRTSAPSIDPATAAKAAALAARNGGSQPTASATPGPAPNFSTMAANAWSNPNAAAVPPASPGVIDPTQPRVLAAIINPLAQAAQAYSQTAMDPRE